MKIAITICEYGAAANIGGDVERTTYVVEVPDFAVPQRVLDHLKSEENKWSTLSLSVFVEQRETTPL